MERNRAWRCSRRSFLSGALSAGMLSAFGGCRLGGFASSSGLRLGVVSDVHVTTPESTAMFRRALEYFKARAVDAVVVPGDLGDWGLRSDFAFFKAAWDEVMSGSGIVPLFCTGNHDYDGFGYGDMTMEMHALGFSERDAIVRNGGMRACWEKIFGEPFADVRCRRVGGYDFISREYRQTDPGSLERFFAEHGGEYRDGRPFFYFQHYPLASTPEVKAILDAYPNCIAFTGHEHVPFYDERSLRQDGPLEVSVPSLSYASLSGGRENGFAVRDGSCRMAMQPLADRFELRGGQGYLVTLGDGVLTIERRDIEEGCAGADDWVVPLDPGAGRPFSTAARAASLGVPEFPSDARLQVETRIASNRQGKWIVAMVLRHPPATCADGTRVYDYEARAVLKDGTIALRKRFFSPALTRLPVYEPKEHRFWFDASELPQDVDYVLEMRACNCFGKSGEPIVSRTLHSQPGLEKCTAA